MTTSDALSNAVDISVNAADSNTTYIPVTLANETFTEATVNTPWLFGNAQQSNQPFLTANNVDVSGNGALRLTDAKLNQAAFAIYDQSIASNQDISISFDFYQYGGTGADGIGLVFLDASKPNPTMPGGYGGSLAYAQRDGIAGLAGGVFGIGFDAYGNYPNPTEGRNEGTQFTPDTVSIRGSEASGYQYLTGNGVPFSLDNPGSSATRDQSYRRATINLTKDGLLSVTVQADLNQDGDFNDTIGTVNETVKVIDSYDVDAVNGELPDSFKIGLTGATGSSTNIHEVRNFKITTCILNRDPEAVDVVANVSSSGAGAIKGLQATDPDGNAIVSYTITSLPDAAIGTLFTNDPAQGGVPIQLGSVIPADQIGQLYFSPAPGFTPIPNTDFASFTYTATDSLGATDKTPAQVTLHSELSIIVDPPGDLRPETLDTTVKLSPGDTVKVTGLSGTDDGTIASFQITNLPNANQGKLFLGNPANGGTAVDAERIIAADQIDQLYFQSKNSFTGSGFKYAAIDNAGQIDLTPATVRLADSPRPGCKIGKRLKGDARRNKLRGDIDRDMLMGKGGKDHLSGKGCVDELMGGRGNDALYGGANGDRLQGGRRHDRLHGNQGDDVENGGLGNDAMFGGRGKDGLRGGRGRDALRGRYGDDVLYGGRQNDDLRGGANHDLLRGNQQDDALKGQRGADVLNGGLGSDKLFGGIGADVLRGRRGNDLLDGGVGRDTLDGGLGDDVLVGSRQADLLIGGEGADRFVYNSLFERADRITDFEAVDVIDLRAIVSGDRYNSSNPFGDYVRLAQQGSSTVVSVDTNGDLAPGGFKALTILNNLMATSVGANNFIF